MWVNEQTIETTAPTEAIWRAWADVERWGEWNADIERIELDGSFETGSRILMTPRGGDPIELRIAEATKPTSFVDEADLGNIVVRTVHHAAPTADGRTRVTYRMEITGADADTLGPELGPQISGDFPETLAALAARAESS